MYLVTARIATEQPQSVSIIGGPRSGKTSLINYLTEASVREEYLTDSPSCVLVQIELGKSPPDCPKTFFLQISEALQQAGEAAIEPNTDGFDKAVKRLMKAEKKMVLFLDDFGTVTQNSRFALNFFSFLRSVANGSDVGYVTTSSLPLQELCHTEDIEDSPFFNIFTTVNLEPFSEEAARQLVQKPAEQAGQPFGKEVEWIWQLAGGFPQLL
jgi:DNA replication protein DnaC